MLRDWIEGGLKKPGKTARGLAGVLHVHPSQVTRILKDERRIKADELSRIAHYLEIEPPDFIPPFELEDPGKSGPVAAEERGSTFVPLPNTVPLFVTRERQDGVLEIDLEKVDDIERPQVLAREPSAYALLVSGYTMGRAFRPGERALIHPRLPMLRGEDHVLRTRERGGLAIIREVVSYDADSMVARQIDPPADIRVGWKDWPICHRIVGKFART